MSQSPPNQKLIDISQSKWKAYFSMYVLGQTDPIYNTTINLDEWWLHQSCSWSAIVTNFEYRNNSFYCYHCGYPTKEEFCESCNDSPCWECGDQYCKGYCEGDSCAYCGATNSGGTWCSRTCRRLSNQEG